MSNSRRHLLNASEALADGTLSLHVAHSALILVSSSTGNLIFHSSLLLEGSQWTPQLTG